MTRSMLTFNTGGSCILSGIECLSRGLPQPAGTVLISPWIDMSTHPRDGGNALMETDYVIGANTVTPAFAAKWLNGISAISPEVNPLYVQSEKLQALNPQLILVGGGEFALQEAKDWASLCRKAGVKHRIVCEWGELHIYALGSSWIEPSVRRRTDASIIDWMKQCLLETGN
jgi:acetyl esterase/lipase